MNLLTSKYREEVQESEFTDVTEFIIQREKDIKNKRRNRRMKVLLDLNTRTNIQKDLDKLLTFNDMGIVKRK